MATSKAAIEAGTAAQRDADDAIRQSIMETRIVHVAWSERLEAVLTSAAEDYADTGAVVECWGVDDGSEWRVHLDR